MTTELDKKISSLPEVTTSDDTDVLTVLRPTDPVGTKNKKITKSNFLKEVVLSISNIVTSLTNYYTKTESDERFLQEETDPIFSQWLIDTPPIYEETDPVFNEWLSTTPPLYSEEDPDFNAWLQTNPLAGFLTEEQDPMFYQWLSTNPLSGYVPNSKLSEYLALDQRIEQQKIKGELYIEGQQYIYGTPTIVDAPTDCTASITYIRPSPSGGSTTEVITAPTGQFVCSGTSTDFYLYSYQTQGDDTTYSEYPNKVSFTDSNTHYTSPNMDYSYPQSAEYLPQITTDSVNYATYSEARDEYTIGDPADNYSSYVDTNGGSLIDQAVSISVWAWKYVGGTIQLCSATALNLSLSDYTTTNFQAQFGWSAVSGADGYIVQATADGGSTYYNYDCGNNAAVTIDGSWTYWTPGGFSPSVSSPFYWGGTYMYNDTRTFTVYAFKDTPLGKVYSGYGYPIYVTANYDYVRFDLSWDAVNGAEGYLIINGSTSYTATTTSTSMQVLGDTFTESDSPAQNSVYCGGTYMYGAQPAYTINSYYDSPMGRVFSEVPGTTSISLYNDNSGVSLSWNTSTGPTGYIILKSTDNWTTIYAKDVGDVSSYIDDGSAWTDSTDLSPYSRTAEFNITGTFTKGISTGTFAVWTDVWGGYNDVYYQDLGTSEAFDTTTGWDLLSNHPTEEAWYLAHQNGYRPYQVETADGVVRNFSAYGLLTYQGVNRYSLPTNFSVTPDNSGMDFYMDIAGTAGANNEFVKLKYGNNYVGLGIFEGGFSYSTNGAVWTGNSTVTPNTEYGVNPKIYSDYWFIDETGYNLVGAGNISGTLTDQTTATRSGANTFTGTATFKGVNTNTQINQNRVAIGLDTTANNPEIILERNGQGIYVQNFVSGGVANFKINGATRFAMGANGVNTSYSSLSCPAGLTGTTANMTGQVNTSNLVIGNAYTNNLTQFGISYVNTSSTGQSVFANTIGTRLISKWRTDYLGGVSWAAGLGSSVQGAYSGYHDFYTGGDYGTGGSSKKQLTLRASYNSNGGETKCAQGSVGILMLTADNPYTEFDIMHKVFMDTTKSAMLFSPTALANRVAVETLMTHNYRFIGSTKIDGILTTDSGIIGKITNATNTYSILTTDETVICNKATAFTVTLFPTVTATIGQRITIKNIGVGVVTVKADTTGTADLIDGVATKTLNQWDSLRLVCYNVDKWGVI